MLHKKYIVPKDLLHVGSEFKSSNMVPRQRTVWAESLNMDGNEIDEETEEISSFGNEEGRGDRGDFPYLAHRVSI